MKTPRPSLLRSAPLASAWHHLPSPARVMAPPQPPQTKHEQDGRRTAMLPPWMPYVHTIQHTFYTSQCTALSSDRSPPPVRNPCHTAYTDRNIGGIFGHETRILEACNRPWSRTSVHNPGIGECVLGWHGGPPASNNGRLFACTSHGNLGRAEYTFASPRPCDALLGPTSVPLLTRPRTMHKLWVRS